MSKQFFECFFSSFFLLLFEFQHSDQEILFVRNVFDIRVQIWLYQIIFGKKEDRKGKEMCALDNWCNTLETCRIFCEIWLGFTIKENWYYMIWSIKDKMKESVEFASKLILAIAFALELLRCLYIELSWVAFLLAPSTYISNKE